ncbi:MAG TPA: hypothetical protein VJ953_10030 [Saprospiraceae bacterium]|nr:hypothetical protein [Saprospiraceae bacterium]
MKQILALIGFLILYSCGTEDFELQDNSISNEERVLLNDCNAAAIRDSVGIAENLMGEWLLVGYACGGCNPGPKVNISLIFNKSTGVASYEYDGFVDNFSFDWRLEPYLFNQRDTVYILQANPPREYLYIPGFCEEYMFADNSVNDGAMYLYEKQ